MGYFDYLDENKKSADGKAKEYHNYDPIAKTGMWIWFGALGVTILSIILLFACWNLGKSIWLDVFLVLGFGCALIAVAFCINARRMASRVRQETQLGNCIFIWGIFLALINLILLVVNTYMFIT